MAVNFKTPSSPSKSVLTIDTFLGCDFTNSPANVDDRRSPNCVNMIRDVPGKVRKCMGWQTIRTFGSGNINGYHKLLGDSDYLIHVGTKIYRGSTELYSSANDAISKSWQFEEKLYIIDGKKMLVYSNDGTPSIKTVESEAYIPTVTIAKEPSGGGQQYEDLNLLQPAFIELFAGTTTDSTFQLSFKGLDSTRVKAWLLNSSGDWVEKTEGTHFNVNRSAGTITFTSVPGKSPLTGEDNVKIQAYRTVEGYADRINKCSFGTLFGVNGALDRLFLSGNPDYRNYDWFSAQYDPTYFEDTSYSKLGSDSSAIVGYSIISNLLAAHKDDMERDQNIILRQGDLEDNKPIFRIANTLQGAGAIAKHSFAYLSTEPLFLTKLGIYAVTAQDVTGEKYAQNRSFYLNGKLLDEQNLENAFGFVYKDFYWLCINGVAYILDGLQPVQTDKSMPYSTRQYVGFYRTNLPANIMWENDGELYFGTKDGRICKFYSDKADINSYNDDGQAISCVWETPDLDGKLFYKNKTVRYLAVRIESASATSVTIHAMKRGLWQFIKRDDSTGRYLVFSQLVFSKFSFSPDKTQRVTATKVRIKKVDKFRFRFSNEEKDEPLGLYDIGIEFIENGNFKG